MQQRHYPLLLLQMFLPIHFSLWMDVLDQFLSSSLNQTPSQQQQQNVHLQD